MASRKPILGTSMSGLIDMVCGRNLAEKHVMRALNRHAVDGAGEQRL